MTIPQTPYKVGIPLYAAAEQNAAKQEAVDTAAAEKPLSASTIAPQNQEESHGEQRANYRIHPCTDDAGCVFVIFFYGSEREDNRSCVVFTSYKVGVKHRKL